MKARRTEATVGFVQRLLKTFAVLAALTLCVVPAASAGLSSDASRAFDRSFFTASPGGISASAARVAQWRRLALRATRGTRIGADLVEGMIFVESSGRSRVVGLDGRRGLTQLSTRRLAPLAQLRATVRRLERAQRVLGRTDLAVASYHLGVRPLLRMRGRPYASFYFAARNLSPAADYYWKVLAAERVLRLWRHDRAALRYEERLQARKNSAEEVLHPRTVTPQFRTPAAIARAWRRHVLVAIPRDPRRTHIAISPSLGQLAHSLGRSRRLYTGLRPAARDVLLYIGERVHALSHARRPLLLTSAVRDDRYQRLLTSVNPVATRAYSMHTTGYAFDIVRSYGSPRQAAAFAHVLRQLAAVNAIAYIKEFAAMHIAVASDARAKLELLRRLS